MPRFRVDVSIPAAAVSAAALIFSISPSMAGTPAMSVKAGSSAACGGPEALCVPGADVFEVPNVAAPVVVDTLAALGLQAGDNITSMSCRGSLSAGARVLFSVTSGSVGVAGTAPDVASEAAAGEVGADIFDGGVVGAVVANTLLADDDGTISSPAGPFAGLGLAETDDIDALAACDLSDADTENLYFTLGPGSPTIALIPTASAAAVYVKSIGTPGLPTLAFQAAHMGLTNADVLDAFVYDVGMHKAAYSLAPGSPSLGTIPALPGDILQGFGTPLAFIPGSSLGLAPGDDLDGLILTTDADLDVAADSRDNCPGVPNNDQFDTDGDNTGDQCDDSDLDGTVDPDDNCPDYPNPAQADADADDVGDDCDACTNVGGVRDMVSGKVSIGKINTDVVTGNDSLKIGGRFITTTTPFSMLDIENRSVRIVVRGATGATIVDAQLPYGAFTPGGAGWTTKAGKLWQFKDESGSPVAGITSVKIVDQSKKTPGLLQMSVSAKAGDFPVTPSDSPLTVTLVAGDQTSSALGDCGDAAFEVAKCKFNGALNKLGCKLP